MRLWKDNGLHGAKWEMLVKGKLARPIDPGPWPIRSGLGSTRPNRFLKIQSRHCRYSLGDTRFFQKTYVKSMFLKKPVVFKNESCMTEKLPFKISGTFIKTPSYYLCSPRVGHV